MTSTAVQTINHNVVTNAEDGSGDTLQTEVIRLGCGQRRTRNEADFDLSSNIKTRKHLGSHRSHPYNKKSLTD